MRTVPGTGLSVLAIGGILVASIATFIFWGGPLWQASREASHLWRIVVSYSTAVPLVAVALALVGRWSLGRLTTGVGVIWSVKLVTTALFYVVAARGTATDLQPQAVSLDEPSAAATAPAAPKVAAPTRIVRINIADSNYDRPEYAAVTGQTIEVRNTDDVLHTLHLHVGDKTLSNQPLPPSNGVVRLPAPAPGRYRIRCDTHPKESASLVTVEAHAVRPKESQ